MAVPAALRSSTAGVAATAARRTGHAYAPGVAVVVALLLLLALGITSIVIGLTLQNSVGQIISGLLMLMFFAF